MALEIKITPTIQDNGNGMPTTNLEVLVDLRSILKPLKEYDLLLKTVLEVTTPAIESDGTEVNRYEYAQIYRNIQGDTITFSIWVLGEITETQSIKGIAQGVFVSKKQ